MAAIAGNEFTSFNAASVLYQGNQACLTGNNVPLISGLTLSGVNPAYTGNIDLQGWPVILRNDTKYVVNGNVLTLTGDGIGQILLAWDETSDSGTGKHSSLYTRSKSSTPTAAWSPWFEVLDSGNFTKYIATSTGEGASGTWNINILGNASAASFLLPITANGTYERATYTLPSGSSNVIIWSEAFGDNTLQYAANGELHNYTDTGDIVFYLSPNPTDDELLLNMYINGTYEGYFKGDLNGTATKAVNAALTTITNTLTYFDNTLGHFNYTPYIKYLKHLSVSEESGQVNAAGYSDGLIIHSTGTYYSLQDVIAQQNGILQYGDAGPQIRFTTDQRENGVILFNTNPETAGLWPSFHFLGQTITTTQDGTTTTNSNITIKSAGVVAHQKATIGAQTLDTSYTLSVNGQSGFYNNINMINALIHFSNNKQYIEWYDTAAQRVVNDDESIGTGLKWNGIGTYTDSNSLLLNISNYDGINITTKDNVTLYHNNNIIPASTTASIGDSITPIYIVDGIFYEASYTLSATILASSGANRMAYYNDLNSIDDAAHYVSNSKIAINSTDEPSYTLYVNGTVKFSNNLSIGATGNKTISFIGTNLESNVITFVDNGTDATGNGLILGAGGLAVLGAGSCGTSTTILDMNGIGASTKILYLLSDGAINIEAGAETFANRTGIQITGSGDVIPVVTEAVHTNAQSLGASSARWAGVFIGTADTYGGEGTPVYWDNGVPKAISYSLGASVNSGTKDRLAFYSANGLIGSTTITSNGSYLGNVSNLSINHAHQTNYNLYVNGPTYLTGNVVFAPTGSTGTSAKLSWSGSGDSASIYYKVAQAEQGNLVLNTGDDVNCLISLAYNDGYTMQFNTSVPNFFPATSGGSSSLGIGANGTEANARRWGKIFVGTADSYGDAYTPIYWNAGVPTAVTVVQQVDFTIAKSATSTVITKTNIFTANTIVLQIVVTEGEGNLNSAIGWESAANKVTLTTTATSGVVKGYIITARGAKL